MIHSMTAFARTQQQGPEGSLTCEIRSTNHRYLESTLHLPDALRSLEPAIREVLRQSIQRGKVECAIRHKTQPAHTGGELILNEPLASALGQACERVSALVKNVGTLSPLELLRYPGVLDQVELNENQLQAAILPLVKQCLVELMAARNREGKALAQLFEQRMVAVQEELQKVRSRSPLVLQEQRGKLFKRFAEASIELDNNRLEQEMLISAQKMDITEEIERIETHIEEVRRVVKKGGLAGRRLDFLMQELNREANTLGSKSTDTILTHAAVEIKVLIEQMREQVQNIE